MLDLFEVEKESANLVVIRRQGSGSNWKRIDAGSREPSARQEATAMLGSQHKGSDNATNGDRFGEFPGLRELGKVVASLWASVQGPVRSLPGRT